MESKNAAAPRAVALLALIGLLGWSWWRNQKNVIAPAAPSLDGKIAPAAPDALQRYGFSLTESAKALGVDFVHTTPKLDPKLEPILPRVADMGAGVAVTDYDKDGWLDFYVTRSGERDKNALYHNKGNGTFEEVAGSLGVADLNLDGTGTSQGALWGDFDGDSYPDLLVYKWGRAELFRNEQGKSFKRMTETAQLPKWMNANAATLFDYDNDGKLDILLCGYFDEGHDLWHLKTTKIMPDAFNFATNGALKHLLHNEGNFTFRDTTQEMGMTNRSWLLAAIAADLRGTGYPDLFLASDYGTPELWLNEGGKKFVEIGRAAGISKQAKSGMNAAFGDIYNDGRLSIYISNIWEDGQVMQGNNLWVPREGLAKGELEYENLADSAGVEKGGWSFGAQFGDLNNDGFQDLYLTNGYISADKAKNYWYDYATITPANAAIISDVVNWPPIKGRSLSGYQQKRVWLNDGSGRFTEVAQAVGASDLFDGRAVALADLDNNGTLDVIVGNQRGPLLIYKNQADPKNHWLTVALEGKNPIGAEVTLYWNGMKQRQVVATGMGFCAQNDPRPHFGLGAQSTLEKVEIRWPGGKIQSVTAPKADQILIVKESNS